MRRSILMSSLVFFFISCKNSSKTHPVNAGTFTASGKTKKDTVAHLNPGTTIRKSFPKSTDIFMVVTKMDNHAALDNADYNIIDRYLLYNHDEDGSEGIGYSMYNYLKGNKPANEGYFYFLNNKGIAFKEKIFPKLINLMCIDIADDKYTYEKLVSDFSLFKESNAAEKALKTCIVNAGE
jgi:hypothetical protein